MTTAYTHGNLACLKTVSATGLLTTTYGYDRLTRLTSAAQPNGTNTCGVAPLSCSVEH